MTATRVIPCLLLKGRGLVKTVKFKEPRYVGDPINAVRIFNDKEVHELVFLDITATRENRTPPLELVSVIANECSMPFSIGGGIRDTDTIHDLLSMGAEKVVINSYAVENPAFIEEAAGIAGSQSIVVSLDVKKEKRGNYSVYTHNGSKSTSHNPVDLAVKMENMGAGEIFLNSIDRDGTGEGYDLELITMVSEKVNIPVIACGGAGKITDFADAVNIGHASAVAAGSMFVFHGRRRAVLISFPEKEELSAVLD